MKIKSILSASALVFAFGLAVPAAAQVDSTTTAGPTTASGEDSTASSESNSLDLTLADDSFNSDSSNRSTNDSNNDNDSSSVVANQLLLAVNANSAALNFQSEDEDADYSSGNNEVNDSAFAAFSGILNQGWNTGINANAQAATNIAARGTVTFSQ